ncbi:hypothetical protein [Cupriavidus sp. BIS7]|uniref:hypothetical protein n=1 Tax=Cupriavidus sp. BIS7 TaxID=1217718 RepID=UPI00030F4744|nr:hypothetical protein [Cupriavidus sp. BIS7]
MGEWSEYFEDFPEENSANYVNGRFDPKGAEALRTAEAKLRRDQGKLDAEIRAIVQKHRTPAPDKK